MRVPHPQLDPRPYSDRRSGSQTMCSIAWKACHSKSLWRRKAAAVLKIVDIFFGSSDRWDIQYRTTCVSSVFRPGYHIRSPLVVPRISSKYHRYIIPCVVYDLTRHSSQIAPVRLDNARGKPYISHDMTPLTRTQTKCDCFKFFSSL